MNRLLYNLLLLLTLCIAISCKQTSREEAQEQFRQRQQAILERDKKNADSEEDVAVAEEGPTEGAPAKPAATAGDKVIGIKDGDTIELLRNGKPVTVRLFGVDTPEKTQDFGERARQYTSELAFGKNVRLIEHNKDRYGRTVGTIILPDGRSLNEELVREGYAWHYTAYSKDKTLANLEADARRFKRGLWQDPNPVAPWDFRKQKPAPVDNSKAPVPAGSTKRQVYLCDSSGSSVYHYSTNCSVLKRCKEQVITVTEAEAIRQHNRRADKTCSPK